MEVRGVRMKGFGLSLMFAFVFLYHGGMVAQLNLTPSKKPSPQKPPQFDLTEDALGNSKTLSITNRTGEQVKVEAISKTREESGPQVHVRVSINCEGQVVGGKFKEVSPLHLAFRNIDNRSPDKLVFCSMENVEMDSFNLHLIVYQRKSNGKCLRDENQELIPTDIVIPIYSNRDRPGVKGFCDKPKPKSSQRKFPENNNNFES